MKLKKIYCFMLAIILVINAPIIAYAESTPGTVSVSGGSIGSGGVEGNSGVLKGTALAVVMATLASVGITVKLAADDYARGNTALNYISNKFAEWENQADAGWEAYQALDSTKIGANGELYIPEVAQSVMQKFLNWLYANDAINYQQSAPDGPFGGAYYGASWTSAAGATFRFGDGVAGYIVAIKDTATSSKYVICPFRQGGGYYFYGNGNSTRAGEFKLDGVTYSALYSLYYQSNDCTGLIDLSNYGYYGRSGFYNWLKGGDYNVPDTNIENTGLYTENTDIPSLVDESGTGKILIVQPGLIPQVQDSYVGSNNASINIQDYLDALTDLYGQQAIPQDITDLPDITIPGEDAITGTKEEVAVIDRELVLAPDLTVPADPGAITWPQVPEIAMPVADPSIPADPDITIPAMTVDLTGIFPFCIPWDLYNLLSKFNAEPVTPSVTINWGNILGSIGVNFTTTLDLHDYDDVASVLRKMETVLFVIGLAVATRNIFTQS